MGFSIIDHPAIGIPPFMETPIKLWKYGNMEISNEHPGKACLSF